MQAVKKAFYPSDGQKQKARDIGNTTLNTLEVAINGMRPIMNEIPVPGFSMVADLLSKVIEAIKVPIR